MTECEGDTRVVDETAEVYLGGKWQPLAPLMDQKFVIGPLLIGTVRLPAPDGWRIVGSPGE